MEHISLNHDMKKVIKLTKQKKNFENTKKKKKFSFNKATFMKVNFPNCSTL